LCCFLKVKFATLPVLPALTFGLQKQCCFFSGGDDTPII
jgi:hypothetical protein